ncbi:hypothetical protein ETB97_005099 [Aspergillus alliaceus]|uniref:Transposase MuDR plant domain-containing protein n=1 Tax=Petromyces alliaceus TaxID=209559 RepID=A0A8H6ADV8_PETAA|nr:hypothetical protein ETB97_005099 [Aspergillus burnettii]
MTEIYSGLHVGQRFASLEEFKALVRGISVRQHWELRVTRSNKKSVVIGCRSSNNCFFRVVCRANKHTTYISSLQDSHSCRSSATSTSKTPVRSEVSHVRFLLNEIPKLFDMRNSIKAQEVVDAVKRYHGYEISIRQAQRALIRLQQQHTQNQEERADTLDSSGDDQQEDSQLPESEEPAEGSTYSSLSGQRWIPETMQHGLMDTEGIQQGGISRNPTLQAPQMHGEALQSHPQLQSSHQIQPTPTVHHPSNIQSPEQASLGNPLNQPVTPHQHRYAVSAPNPPSASQTGQPKPQGRLQSEGHPAAPQLVLTNFKIEFTCTTCGALNQSFFPNHGNVTGGNYLPQPPLPSQSTAAEGSGRSTQPMQGSSGSSRVAEGHGYGADTAAGAHGVQPPWGPGALDVPIAPAHT